MDRRDFLRLGVGAAAAGAIGRAAEEAQSSQSRASGASESRAARALPTVLLGKTGRTVPKLGIGCYPLSTLIGFGSPADADVIATLPATAAASTNKTRNFFMLSPFGLLGPLVPRNDTGTFTQIVFSCQWEAGRPRRPASTLAL